MHERSLVGYCPRGHKELDVTETTWYHNADSVGALSLFPATVPSRDDREQWGVTVYTDEALLTCPLFTSCYLA